MTTKSKTTAIGKASAGWAVSVTSPPVDGDGPAMEETFYAAIPDREEAEKAVAQLAGAPPEVTVKADKRISAKEFSEMGWSAGQIEQWVGPRLATPGA